MSTEEWTAVRLSLQVGATSVLLCLVPGVVVGWLLARKRFPGRALLDALVHLPLVLPPVVVGYLLLISLGRQGWLGSWLDAVFGWRIAFTWQGAALAAAVMGFPLMVRAIRQGIEAVDPRLEDAARTLGAGPLMVWWTVTIPLVWPAICTGMLLAFARSLGEFGATITFAGNIAGQTSTLPVAMYGWMAVPGEEHRVWRLMWIAIALSFAALLMSEWLSRRVGSRST